MTVPVNPVTPGTMRLSLKSAGVFRLLSRRTAIWNTPG